MYPAIRSYDEQAFDNISEESEQKSFLVKKSLQPVPTRGIVERGRGQTKWQIKTPVRESEVTRMCLKA